jgi:hypothetical protein
MEITQEQITDLMVTALEGGINYWCDKVVVKQQPIEDWEFASDIIGLTNGELNIYADGEILLLNKEKFINGVKKTILWGEFKDVQDLVDNHDAETADVLIQFALFDEMVYS